MENKEFTSIETALKYIGVDSQKLTEDYKSSTKIVISLQDGKPCFATVYLKDNNIDSLLLTNPIQVTPLKFVKERYAMFLRE